MRMGRKWDWHITLH